MKINVNTAFIEKEQGAELGAIARDDDELVMSWVAVHASVTGL